VSTNPTRREQAVARSLDSVRTRAEERVQRFLEAGLELMQSGDTGDFTVQEVVQRSGQSLRSFYQYFGGKHELLLALFEESVRGAATLLEAHAAEGADPADRLHRFVVEYYRQCRPVGGGSKPPEGVAGPLMVEFALQLLTAHPSEAARAYAPLVSLLEGLLDEAAEAGVLRSGIDRRSVAGTVLEVVMFNAFAATIAGASLKDADVAAEELWDLLFRGMSERS